MRVSMAALAMVGGMLALGACSPSVEPVNLTLAELAERSGQCSADSELVRTGSHTGDPRLDYRCRSDGHRRGNARDAGVIQPEVRPRPR